MHLVRKCIKYGTHRSHFCHCCQLNNLPTISFSLVLKHCSGRPPSSSACGYAWESHSWCLDLGGCMPVWPRASSASALAEQNKCNWVRGMHRCRYHLILHVYISTGHVFFYYIQAAHVSLPQKPATTQGPVIQWKTVRTEHVQMKRGAQGLRESRGKGVSFVCAWSDSIPRVLPEHRARVSTSGAAQNQTNKRCVWSSNKAHYLY